MIRVSLDSTTVFSQRIEDEDEDENEGVARRGWTRG
jgi:hypothetical protein